jgi:hypothetical protein
LLGDFGDAEPGEGVGSGGQGGNSSTDAVGGLAEKGGAVSGVFADGVVEGGDAAFGGLEGEGDSEAGVVAQADRDGVSGGLLGGQDGEAEHGAAVADQFPGQGDAAAGEAFKGAVAAVLGEVEVGLALIENRDQERQVVGGAAGVPGVPLSAQRLDVAEAAAHFGVLVLEYVEGVGELVAGVAPGAFVPGFLVAAVFAVQERELGGGCRCELAQPGVDEAGFAVAGQPGSVPVVQVIRTVFDSADLPVEVQDSVMAADRHEFRYEERMR